MSTAIVELPEAPSTEEQGAAIGRLMQMSMGYMVSSALSVATKLDIADLLWEGPQPVAELAKQTGVGEEPLYRVLRALASVGIFRETEPKCFALTPAAYPLGRRAEQSVRNLVHWIADPCHYPIWAEIFSTVQTGKPAIEIVHGKKTFEVLSGMPEVARSFNDGMTNISALTAPAILEAYDFSEIRKLVDVGGGHGHLLRSILKRYPGTEGTLYDLESVVHGAAHDERLTLVAGNMFESIPAGADAYMMQHIIHDWDDTSARQILTNCRKALEGVRGGKVLLLEGVIRPGNEPDPNKFIDLEMLTMCTGKERTEEQYRELLASAGLRLNRVVRTTQMVDIIEALSA
jgi:O-methyltransferase domain/Dimerisation domain